MRSRATQFLLPALLLLLSLPTSARLTPFPFPDFSGHDPATLPVAVDPAGSAAFTDVIDNAAYDDAPGGVQVIVLVFSDDPEKGYVGIVGRDENGAIWILYEGKLPLGLDTLDDVAESEEGRWALYQFAANPDWLVSNFFRGAEIHYAIQGALRSNNGHMDGYTADEIRKFVGEGMHANRQAKFAKERVKQLWEQVAIQGASFAVGKGLFFVRMSFLAARTGLTGTRLAAQTVRVAGTADDPARLLAGRRSLFGRPTVAPRSGTKPSFYVTPDGQAIPATGYRAVGGPAVESAQAGNVMSRHGPTYFTFDDVTGLSPSAAQDVLQLKYPPSHVVTFDTLQVIDDIQVPAGKWHTLRTDSFIIPEPITKTFPESGSGGATQAITNTPISKFLLQELPK